MSGIAKKVEIKIKYQSYGITELLKRIESLIMESPYLHNQLYLPWITVSRENKDKFLTQVGVVIRRDLFGADFTKALARDIIDAEGNINVDSYVYKYIRSRVYRGNSRLFLTDLMSVLEQDRKDKLTQKGYYNG